MTNPFQVKKRNDLSTRNRELGGKLSDQNERAEKLSLSLVLLEPALWTRYRVAGNGYASDVHAKGASAGDAVVVTEAPVVAALLAGTLTYAKAEKLELLRFYSLQDGQRFARHLFSTAFPAGRYVEAGR